MKPFFVSLENIEKEHDIIVAGETSIIEENKKMHWKEVLPYFEEKLSKNPDDWETNLRYANALRKNGKTSQSVAVFEKAARLNPNCVSAFANLGEIHFHRFKEFGEKESKQKAIEYLSTAEKMLLGKTGDMATIADRMAVLSGTTNDLSELTKRKMFLHSVDDEELDGPIESFVSPEKHMVDVNDMGKYSMIFYPIERTILDYWVENQSLNDEGVISVLEKLKANFDETKDELGEKICLNVKIALCASNKVNKKFSLGELKSCITRLKNIAKRHDAPDGIGYLKWVKTFFEGKLPETEDEIREYILNEEYGAKTKN